jgi:hypothetical protein
VKTARTGTDSGGEALGQWDLLSILQYDSMAGSITGEAMLKQSIGFGCGGAG